MEPYVSLSYTHPVQCIKVRRVPGDGDPRDRTGEKEGIKGTLEVLEEGDSLFNRVKGNRGWRFTGSSGSRFVSHKTNCFRYKESCIDLIFIVVFKSTYIYNQLL